MYIFFVSATIFTMIGKLLGDRWKFFHKYIDKYLIVLAAFVIVAVVLIYIIKIYKEKIVEFVKRGVLLSVDILHSLGNLRIVVVIAAVLGVLLVDGFVNIIQGLLTNEFEPFNVITYYLVKTIFGSSNIFSGIFYLVEYLTRNYMYIIGLILIIGFIAYKSKEKKLEIQYAIVTLIGGGILEYVFSYVFHLISSNISLFDNLMNKGSYTAILIYGFLGYIVIKNINKKWLKRCIVAVFILICLSTGLAELYDGKILSQVLTGFSLGGIWLTLNIVLLEITRVMPIAKKRRKHLNLKNIRRK
ncbi:hypothetical protein [Clostridium sp.]|uniref:hypothetical protein n=1 Tax=Clostridium sp. TaxID=1506 RepID=UPI003F6798EE